jgi:hypothetical protein
MFEVWLEVYADSELRSCQPVSPPGYRCQLRFGAAQFGQAPGAFTLDQGAQSFPYQSCFFSHTGYAQGFIQ